MYLFIRYVWQCLASKILTLLLIRKLCVAQENVLPPVSMVHCCDFFSNDGGSNNGGTVFKTTLSNQSNTTLFIIQKLHVCVYVVPIIRLYLDQTCSF